MRVLWFLIKVVVVLAAVIWLAERPGNVTVEWQDYQISTTVGVLLLIVVLVAIAYSGFDNLVRILKAAPARLLGTRKERRLEKGLDALTRGFIGVASGDAVVARQEAKRADRYLKSVPLRHLLSAQAAQLSGDEKKAKKVYQNMLLEDQTRHLGLRGLLMQARRDGDEDSAQAIVEEAHEKGMKTPWVLNALFDLQTRAKDWEKALITVREIEKTAMWEKQKINNQRAVLYLALADVQADHWQENVAKAYAQDPTFPPVVARQAESLLEQNKQRKARSVIMDAWKVNPHPMLVEISEIVTRSYNETRHVQFYEKFVKLQPDHYLSHQALGRAALKAKLWGVARNHLLKSLKLKNLFETASLLHHVEKAEGKVSDADPLENQQFDFAPRWVCSSSGVQTSQWDYVSPATGEFNTLEWQEEWQQERAKMTLPSESVELLAG